MKRSSPLGRCSPRGGASALAILVAAIAALALACAEEEAPAPPPPTVTVAQPVVSTVTEYLEFPGTAEAIEVVEVKSRVSGYVDAVLFTEGDRVSQEAVLYRIDPRSLEAALQRAQADLQNAQVRLEEAASEHRRYESLFEEGVVSESEYDQVRAAWLSAQETVAAAEAQVRDAEINLGYTEVLAPISGRVGANRVEAGNFVNAGSTMMTQLLIYDPIHVLFNLSERELLDLRAREETQGRSSTEEKYSVEIGLLNSTDYPFTGEIDFADLGLDPQSGTFLVRAEIPNSDEAILPGQFVRVRFAVEQREGALLVPERALGLDQAGRYVLVVDERNIVSQRPVGVGPAAEAGMVTIAEGIGPEDRIIVNGLQRARPGSPVTPQVEGSGGADQAPTAPGV